MGDYSQDGRHIRIDTPLGPDELLLRKVRVDEAISELFRIEVDLLSETADIDFDAIVRKPVTVSIEALEGTRCFHGIVSRFRNEGMFHKRLYRYSAEIVPWVWLLTRSADCRIFQEMTVPDIIKEVFAGYGDADFEERLHDAYDPRVYCVQYRESDFAFVSRLMEEEGIHYFFEHEDGRHRLVLADDPAENKPCPLQPTAELNYEGLDVPGLEVVLGFGKEQEITTNKVALRDYNFETPNDDLEVDAGEDAGVLERYDYPGEYDVPQAGSRYARIRVEEHFTFARVVHGEGYCRGFGPGFRFDLERHPVDSLNDSYLLTEVRHEAVERYDPDSEIEAPGYHNRFRGIPYDTPFRPLRNTPRPHISGTQTARVVGPAEEEIYTDNHGRIKVQFHWDRLGEKDEHSSCWIRVAQRWAGTNWGAFYLPRIGQEVTVEFLEGDPDRPLVTGSVYNAEHMPPLDLPAEMTKSTLKSRSTLEGTPANFNEIRFEDKKGSEEFYVQAEKDKNVLVKNDRGENVGHDETISIGNDRTETVGHDETITIGNNRTEQVGVDETITIGSNRTRSVGSNETVTVTINRMHTVGVNETIAIGAAQEIAVGAARALVVGGAQSTNIGLTHTTCVGRSQTLEVGDDRTVEVGSSQTHNVEKDTSLKSGKKILIDAGDEIIIKTGKASITMKKSGDISIVGKNINVKGSGNIALKAKKILEN